MNENIHQVLNISLVEFLIKYCRYFPHFYTFDILIAADIVHIVFNQIFS